MQQSSRLRYVDADQVGSEVIDFDGLKVRTPAGDKLGDVDGFIVDMDARRPYYVVVDSGGWFSSQKFLVPIGHARVDRDGDALVVDVPRGTLSRYPEYHRESFERLSDDELRAYERRFSDVCCPDDTIAPGSSYDDSYAHYRQPDWWQTEYYNWDVPAAVGTSGAAALDVDRRIDREVGDARGGDVSPHLGGRAQPGDVIGVETGGERTALGETADDENERRRDAERAEGKQGRDEVRDRRRE